MRFYAFGKKTDHPSGRFAGSAGFAFLERGSVEVLVGEVTNLDLTLQISTEKTKISVEAALTGHLVFTTLHTNDAPGSFTRLEEMGIEPFLMANSTIGIIAQRLARRLCQNCKAPTEVDDTTLGYFGYTRIKGNYCFWVWIVPTAYLATKIFLLASTSCDERCQ